MRLSLLPIWAALSILTFGCTSADSNSRPDESVVRNLLKSNLPKGRTMEIRDLRYVCKITKGPNGDLPHPFHAYRVTFNVFEDGQALRSEPSTLVWLIYKKEERGAWESAVWDENNFKC